MIKIERNQAIDSIMIKDTVWDLKRTRVNKFKLFGVTLYSWSEDHKMTIDQNENNIGFKNGKKCVLQ